MGKLWRGIEKFSRDMMMILCRRYVKGSKRDFESDFMGTLKGILAALHGNRRGHVRKFLKQFYKDLNRELVKYRFSRRITSQLQNS